MSAAGLRASYGTAGTAVTVWEERLMGPFSTGQTGRVSLATQRMLKLGQGKPSTCGFRRRVLVVPHESEWHEQENEDGDAGGGEETRMEPLPLLQHPRISSTATSEPRQPAEKGQGERIGGWGGFPVIRLAFVSSFQLQGCREQGGRAD